MKILKYLEGKKTYILSVLLALTDVLITLEVVTLTPEQIIALNGFILALMSSTTRIALSSIKNGKKG